MPSANNLAFRSGLVSSTTFNVISAFLFLINFLISVVNNLIFLPLVPNNAAGFAEKIETTIAFFWFLLIETFPIKYSLTLLSKNL
ncbi:Uncharacterised protein [Chlamydia abortus]|nr:Uncharacterised protein [Chlamydia abortus]